MLDTYTRGKVERVSPEAPVPILHVHQSHHLPGGAGNVALNLKALGAEVIAIGRVGDDREGSHLKRLLAEEGVNTTGIFIEKEGVTPVKNRLIADAQQLMRVDCECVTHISDAMEDQVFSFIVDKGSEIDVIAISDYGKGFLSNSLLERVIGFAKRLGIPTVVDPKGEDFSKYSGATLIKPNEKEAIIASKCFHSAPLNRIAETLFDQTKAEMLMITRSEKGIAFFEKGKECLEFSVQSKEVKDVTGAGDTVLAVTTLLLASHLDLKETLELANIAAGIAIEKVGCTSVSLSDLGERLLKANALNKIFDQKSLFVLKRVLEGKRVTVLRVESETHLSSSFFLQLQALSKKSSKERLILYFTHPGPEDACLSFLSSIGGIDFILIGCESSATLIENIDPDEGYTLSSDGSFLSFV